jgi:hypothetical protein
MGHKQAYVEGLYFYRHMALVSDMTIEELTLFYFQKKSSEISPYYEIEQDQHSLNISY